MASYTNKTASKAPLFTFLVLLTLSNLALGVKKELIIAQKRAQREYNTRQQRHHKPTEIKSEDIPHIIVTDHDDFKDIKTTRQFFKLAKNAFPYQYYTDK